MKDYPHESSESDEFELQYHQMKKLGLQINKSKLKVGSWSPQQNLIYLNFLEQNRKDFINQQQRRKNKVFYRLSRILKKRTPDQCRSHHQKLQVKYEDDIDKIIQSMQKKVRLFQPQIYEENLKKIDLCHKKTGVTQTVEASRRDQVEIIEIGSFYIFQRKNQNQFILSIFQDCNSSKRD